MIEGKRRKSKWESGTEVEKGENDKEQRGGRRERKRSNGGG